ncbi:MAG TPA: nicotinate-nucleotide diphosphorylase (carboxylating), partial [Acidimicrobiia bacterium]
MTAFDPPRHAVRALVELALAEDLGVLGDITTIACIPDDSWGRARFVSRAEGVVAGTAPAA